MKSLTQLKNLSADAAAYLFVLLFVYAAVSKLLEFEDFQTQLGQSPLLGVFAIPVSYGVPIVELLISFLLCWRRTRHTALYLSFLLMVMFTAYIIIILNFTSFTPCSCGGVLEKLGWNEHLIFNTGFIILAAVGIRFLEKSSAKKILINLLSLFLGGFVLLVIVFLLSEKEFKRNNAFQRKYIPHGLEKLGSYQLESNSFYLAGIDDSFIYLGNYNAPLYLKAIRKDLDYAKEIKVKIENYDLPYKRVQIEVKKNYFFVGDGTVPILFKGNTKDWEAKKISQNDAYFYDFISQDSELLIFTTTNSKTGYTVVGQLKKLGDSIRIVLNSELLKIQADGTFDTDGILLYDSETEKSVYVYFYRNQYEVANSKLEYITTGKTIDTISYAQIDVAYYKKEDSYKLGKSIMVNLTVAIWDGELYINSDRLGKYESNDILKSAGILDRYNTEKNEYIHSFYFYHQPDGTLREFRVLRDTIIGLVDDQLWIQKIKPEFYR